MNAKAKTQPTRFDSDTIAAPATPPGRGGIGIVRVSGPAVKQILKDWLKYELQPRRARLCALSDANGEVLDEALALYFPAPHSYTGEDVLEVHAHGNPLLLEQILGALAEFGVRRARPGEFTERAFLNGRLDLAQAEAVADLIAAGSTQAVRAARRSLQGVFSARVGALREALGALRVEIEAHLDFPDEDIPVPAVQRWREQLAGLEQQLAELQQAAARGRRLNDGLKIAIAGAPNVGKSSLLNALVGDDRAIVSPHPGTTRDVLRETVVIAGQVTEISDLAGLRDSADEVESEGIRRARAELDRADLVIWLDDCRNPDRALPVDLDPGVPVIRVHNKIDLEPSSARRPAGGDTGGAIRISALCGDGLAALRAVLVAAAGLDGGDGDFTARARHLDHLGRCAVELARAGTVLASGAPHELLAEHLRLAADELGALTGKVRSDDLLGQIFSRFCIGK